MLHRCHHMCRPYSRWAERSVRRLRCSDQEAAALRAAYRKDKFSATTRLAAGLAHEIKNPLTVLQGYTQLIMARHAELQEVTALMLTEISTIRNLVEKMLLLARPEAPHLERVDINAVIQAVIDQLQLHFPQRGIIYWQPDPTLPTLCGDAAQIKQALQHIVQNAVESAPWVEIFITAHSRPAESAVRITVTNTGPGMPPSVLAQADTPFFSTKSGTNGLGLTIARAVAENHGGTLTITSPVYSNGAGTRVCITLPYRPPWKK